MKKVYLLGAAFLFGGVAMGQSVMPISSPEMMDRLHVASLTNSVVSHEDKHFLRGGNCTYAGSIWEENFDIGTTGPASTAGPTFTTLNGTWTSSGPNGDVWKHSFFPTEGDYSGGTGMPGTPTEGNGFMLFDVDSANAAAGSFSQRTGYLDSPIIDCSGLSTVALTVNQDFRTCCSSDMILGVQVSNDGGTSWSLVHDLLGGVGTNDAFNSDLAIGSSTNTDLSIDITADAAGSNQVVLRFVWDGLATSSVTHYYWVLDDICVGGLPANDEWLIDSWHQSTNPINIFGVNVVPTYYHVPDEQVDAMDFAGSIHNFGSATAANVTLDVTAQGGTYTGSSTPITQVSGSTDTVSFASYTPPATPSTIVDFNFDVSFSGTDAITVNNQNAYNIEVTDAMYRCDNDWYNGSGWWNGETTPGVNVNGFDLGNVFHMVQDQMLFAVRVVPTASTDPNVIIFPRIYQYDDIAADFVLVYDGQGFDEYNVTAADIPTGAPDGTGTPEIVLPLSTPFNMLNGQTYLVCAGHYGGGPEAFVVAGGGHTDFAHALMYDYTATAAPFWIAGFTTAPMVRADFTAVGVNDIDVTGVNLMQNSPNPTSDVTSFSYNLLWNAEVSFEIVDVTGKIVYTMDQGTQQSGVHRFDFDASVLADGVYYYSLNVNGTKTTKKMIVAK